jgi:glucosamine-6-phosphate deaminase
MERVYARLGELHREAGLDFSLCRTFNLDEYVGLPADHPGSYRHYMTRQLFDHVNIDPRNTYLPDGTAPDLALECRHYDDLIREFGGIDLQLLGIGSDGHIGFNEPLSSLRSRTREKALTPDTIRQNAFAFGGAPDRVPKRALTMGVGTILEADEIVTLVTGTAKAEIVARAVEGPMTAMVTGSALQLHPNCKVIVDEEAAAGLTARDYYDWIFAHEPEWAGFR